MSAMRTAPAKFRGRVKGRLWAGHVYHATVLLRLCKVHYLRIAAVGMADGESRLSTLPASDALHAALRTNVLEGLTAVVRRVSHE